jgi:RNA polymerase sigma-70 factor (ECF subfamily)
MRRVAAGDEAALRELYEATVSCTYGLALRILREESAAEEVTVEVYARLWRRARTYDAGKGSVPAWIGAMTRSSSIGWLRSRARSVARANGLEHANGLAAADPDPIDASEAGERAQRVRDALDTLPSEQRHLLLDAFFGGQSHRELAESHGTPLGTVKSRIRAGLAGLRRALAPLEDEQP